ncbi:amino acid processing protein [Bacillus sp. SA1-12]|uniref:alanine racemase n=1 Tax=Bacillus sp. SA1-12 TaxID=1455638 RepID=UPI0006251B98|nr:alanine racemase [Bacillus sp. SA1-12]KKI92118.1 amino acid processing protein [Bacillus sp. SA1-12]
MKSTPYVYVDLDKVDKNIQSMANRLKRAGIDHWPHIKTHKSVELAKRQLEAGAKGITCAKLSEAEIMAEAGIQLILIAYPLIGTENLQRLGKLAEKIQVRTTVDSYVVAEGISKVGEALGKRMEVLIEIDGGSHRGGVQPGEDAVKFALDIAKLPGIEIVGIFTYVGQIYGFSSEVEVKRETLREANILLETKELLHKNGIDVSVTSGGSTLSSFHAEQLKGISESRAGNYIFGDMNSIYHGIHSIDDCALKVLSTIVSVPLPGYATIDAGSKTLTSDLSVEGSNYGHVVGRPDVKITKLNEEHGYIRYNPECITFHVGDQIEIIPNHSCVIPNLNDFIFTYRNGEYAGPLTIDARGKNF